MITLEFEDKARNYVQEFEVRLIEVEESNTLALHSYFYHTLTDLDTLVNDLTSVNEILNSIGRTLEGRRIECAMSANRTIIPYLPEMPIDKMEENLFQQSLKLV